LFQKFGIFEEWVGQLQKIIQINIPQIEADIFYSISMKMLYFWHVAAFLQF